MLMPIFLRAILAFAGHQLIDEKKIGDIATKDLEEEFSHETATIHWHMIGL